ncbi:hypothetical protein PAXINDRAFT_20982 [Paxillus involutus ATCC 200175]|uniref:Uncharacterized protein n=1 Tax=Paxillus involutus ATCC 200175 TaxID=664439 RepID=A0A0C9T2P7_PAXIN|nr:hypothetical protein PAXINDRAFT_20982 [Paxillus involutus ATCC 200175]
MEGRRCAHHDHTLHIHKTPAQPHDHAKRRASTQGVDSQACTASMATPAVSTHSTNKRKTRRQGRGRKVRETKRNEGDKGRQGRRSADERQKMRRQGADDLPTPSTRRQHAKHRTSTPGVDSRCAPQVRPPQQLTRSTNTRRDEEVKEGREDEGR